MLAIRNGKRIVMALAAMGSAATAGYVVQNGATLPFADRAGAPPPADKAVLVGAVPVPALPDLPPAEVTRAVPRPLVVPPAGPEREAPALPVPAIDEEPVVIARAELGPDIGLPVPAPAPAPAAVAQDGCEVGFTAMASPAAMVDLTLEAPCYANRVVDITHAGLRFTEITDRNGLVQVAVPAMEEEARFTVTFPDGRRESVDALMLTLAGYKRVALAWKGDAGFDLHALEDGAGYGDEGHVWSQKPGAPDRAVFGNGGFATRLGNLPMGFVAVIYTYPAHLDDSRPPPEISIEAEVKATNCGTTISATYLEAVPGRSPMASDLTMAVPGCDAAGEFLVLKNPGPDPRIAGN